MSHEPCSNTLTTSHQSHWKQEQICRCIVRSEVLADAGSTKHELRMIFLELIAEGTITHQNELAVRVHRLDRVESADGQGQVFLRSEPPDVSQND
jgi:hypothetical protein